MVIIWGIGDVLPVKLVVATALIAISRKVIIFNYKAPMYILSTGAVVLALGITYWLLLKVEK